MSLNNLLSLRLACDGEGGSGKSTAARLISKKYNLFYMNSGLLFRYASFLIIKHKPKKIIYASSSSVYGETWLDNASQFFAYWSIG